MKNHFLLPGNKKNIININSNYIESEDIYIYIYIYIYIIYIYIYIHIYILYPPDKNDWKIAFKNHMNKLSKKERFIKSQFSYLDSSVTD